MLTEKGRKGSGREANGARAGRPLQCLNAWGGRGQNDVRRERQKLLGISLKTTGVARCPAVVDPHVAAVGPAQLLQPLQERRDAGLSFRIVGGEVHEHADAPHPLALLRARRERPGCRRAAERTKKFSPPLILPNAQGERIRIPRT